MSLILEELRNKEKDILDENELLKKKIEDNNLKLKDLEQSLFDASQKAFPYDISIQDLINNVFPLHYLDAINRLHKYCQQFEKIGFNGYRSLKRGQKVRPVLFFQKNYHNNNDVKSEFNDYYKFILDTVDSISKDNISIYETNLFLNTDDNIDDNILFVRDNGIWKSCFNQNNILIDYEVYNNDIQISLERFLTTVINSKDIY